MESFQLSPKIHYEHLDFSHNALDIDLATDNSSGLRLELQESLNSVKPENGLSDSSQKLVCEYENCGKTFTQLSALQKHERMHRGEKPYVCATCGQSFTQVSNLKRHERLHTGEKPYACDQCDKAFSTVSNLKQHQQIHESNADRIKFECQRCQKTYFYQSSLNKHMKSHEKKDAKKALEKENKSLSPLKTGKALSKETSDNWDDSITSDDQFSDLSPTLKKVKKEKVAVFNQLSPNTAAETPNTSSVGSLNNQKLEEEFVAHYNKSLAKILDQTNNSTEESALKSILNLKYLSISDLQPNFPSNPGFKNPDSRPRDDKAFPGQQDISLKYEDFPAHFPEPHVGYSVSKMEQPMEAFEEYKPIYNFLGTDLFSQKPKLESEEFHMKVTTDVSKLFNHDFPVGQGELNIEVDLNDMGEIMPKNFLEVNDMVDYDLRRFQEIGWHENDHGVGDKWIAYDLKKEGSDPNLMKNFLENTPFDFLQ